MQAPTTPTTVDELQRAADFEAPAELVELGVDDVEAMAEPAFLGDDLSHRDRVIAALCVLDPQLGAGYRRAAADLDRQVAGLLASDATVEDMEAELAATPRWREGHRRRVALCAALRRRTAELAPAAPPGSALAADAPTLNELRNAADAAAERL